MRYLLLLSLSFIHFGVLCQKAPMSPFVGIPDFAKQIADADNENAVINLYSEFETLYPEKEFQQVHFLRDQVYIAVSKRLLAYNKKDALKYIVKIVNTNDRNKLLEELPVDYWQLSSTRDFIKDFKNAIDPTNFNESQIVLTELLMYVGRFKESIELLVSFPNQKALLSKYPKLFINLYRKNGNSRLSMDILSDLVRQGKGDVNSKRLLNDIWLEIYSNDIGFEEYFQGQIAFLTTNLEKNLQAKMASYEAPNFDLLNLHGEKVELKDLKGKVVLLDFWATWCAPCIASFPTMKRVIEQYKSNPDVVFLFVNTMERNMDENERIHKIQNVLHDKGFDFQVLMDTKVNGQYDLVHKYKIGSIPTQFIIDKKGLVRFVHNGFSGNAESMYNELNVIIKTALKL